MTLGEKIKKIRCFQRIKQREIAEKIGVSDAQIRQYELGIRHPKPQTLSDIANALEVGTTVLTDIDMTTLGDIKSILFQLNQKVGLKLVGEIQENGRLKEGTITISFEDVAIDGFLKEWADKLQDFEQLDKPTQKKALAGEIHDMGLDYEFESFTQCDSQIIVAKEHKGEYKNFS